MGYLGAAIRSGFLSLGEAIGLMLEADFSSADIDDWAEASVKALRATSARVFPKKQRKPHRRNGYRHCVWTCMLCRKLGTPKARAATNYHETYRNELDRRNGELTPAAKADSKADLKNNSEGIKCCLSVSVRPSTPPVAVSGSV